MPTPRCRRRNIAGSRNMACACGHTPAISRKTRRKDPARAPFLRSSEEASLMLRDHARTIWQAAVDAADPRQLVRDALNDPERPLQRALAGAQRILVAGAGKAGAAMCLGVEDALEGVALDKLQGIVNVPEFSEPPPLKKLT